MLTVVVGFEVGRGGVGGVAGDLAVKSAVVEPVDVGEGGELDVVEAAPGPAAVDELPLVEPVEALGEGVVALAYRADGGDDTGFGVVLAQSLPPFAETELGPAVDGILARNGLSRRDIGRFICHPGGARVLMALESALSLESGTLDHERAVLAEYGNMSSPTILFVLERALKEGLPERSAMVALGPGFSASCVTLKRAA